MKNILLEEIFELSKGRRYDIEKSKGRGEF